MDKSANQDMELETLIKDLLKDLNDGSIETKLRKENKKLGNEGKHRDKIMDVMHLVKSYRESGTDEEYKCPFKPGDIVTWKKGMLNKTVPKEGQPAVVLSVDEKPYMRKGLSATSPSYSEELDVRLGWVDDRGVFTHFLYNSRRFELFNKTLVETTKKGRAYENTYEKLLALVESIKNNRLQHFKPGDIVVVRSGFETEYRHILMDTDTPCVVINYLEEPIQSSENGVVLDMTIGIKYPEETSLTLLNVESYKFVSVELI